MKGIKRNIHSLEELAEEWGIDFQTFTIKTELIDIIKSHCEEHGISQRKLAAMVPHLTQDRVSKIFSGQVGHMTIDKLVTIASALEIKITLKAA
jgi:predicted XRE-type DNA-binding protein